LKLEPDLDPEPEKLSTHGARVKFHTSHADKAYSKAQFWIEHT